MNDTFKLLVMCIVAVGLYYKGYIDGAGNELVQKTSSLVQKANDVGKAVTDFKNSVNDKADAVMKEIKSWFRFKKGDDGKIYLDPESPIYDDVDRMLQDSTRVREPREPDSRPSS